MLECGLRSGYIHVSDEDEGARLEAVVGPAATDAQANQPGFHQIEHNDIVSVPWVCRPEAVRVLGGAGHSPAMFFGHTFFPAV